MLQSAIKKKCSGCRRNMTIDEFGINKIDKGKAIPYATCVICRVRGDKNNHSDAGRAYKKKHNQTEKRKASNKRAHESEAGKESRKRENAAKRQRRAADPAFAMMHKIGCAATHLASGERKNSPTFVQCTSFRSSVHFRNHLRSKIYKGVEFKDHGNKWEVEHKIPVQAYDFRDKKDIKRCWSEANVHTMPPKENMEKSIKIIDSLCEEVDKEFWPLSWGGCIPNEQEKQAFYAKCKQSGLDLNDLEYATPESDDE